MDLFRHQVGERGIDQPVARDRRLAGEFARDDDQFKMAAPVFCARMAGMTGSLIVAEFNSLEEAKAWINADPYITEGVFAKITVRPFRKVFPK